MAGSHTADDTLAGLQTEMRNPNTADIDAVSTLDMCRMINAEDATIAAAVARCIPDIAHAIDLIVARICQGGRLVYIGAGTSGRLGVLDASELPPTFSASPSAFLALIAGGDTALRRSAEGAEDTSGSVADLEALRPPLAPRDVLVGIAASGRTPYVLAGLAYAKGLGVLTLGVACVQGSAMREKGDCECVVECAVGPEAVAGSTRMKAGTATKMILNMVSTGVMVRMGKTFGNIMIDVNPSNEKLRARARRIFRLLAPLTTRSDAEIDAFIKECDSSVKLALVVERLRCPVDAGRARLRDAGGALKRAWGTAADAVQAPILAPNARNSTQVVLCVDAGGTKCVATIAARDGTRVRAQAGPCNFVTQGHTSALAALKSAVSAAAAQLPAHLHPPAFAAAWIGGAGLDRAFDLAALRPAVQAYLCVKDASAVWLTNDAALLAAGIEPGGAGVVLAAGTGTVALAYGPPPPLSAPASASILPSPTLTPAPPTPLARAGGWGFLLGDEGSAYAIGRAALRAALSASDHGAPPTPLHRALAVRFACEQMGELISRVYDPAWGGAGTVISADVEESTEEQDENKGERVDKRENPKLRVAGLCRTVCEMADAGDEEARGIVEEAAEAAAELVCTLVARVRSEGGLDAGTSGAEEPGGGTLVLGGALTRVHAFVEGVERGVRDGGARFARVRVVRDAAEEAVEVLVRAYLGGTV